MAITQRKHVCMSYSSCASLASPVAFGIFIFGGQNALATRSQGPPAPLSPGDPSGDPGLVSIFIRGLGPRRVGRRERGHNVASIVQRILLLCHARSLSESAPPCEQYLTQPYLLSGAGKTDLAEGSYQESRPKTEPGPAKKCARAISCRTLELRQT